MSIYLSGLNAGIQRVSVPTSVFQPANSWTTAMWIFPATYLPNPAQYRQFWAYGDAIVQAGPYVAWLGNIGVNNVVTETFDGTTFTDTAGLTLTNGTWFYLSTTYDSVAHTVSFYVNNTFQGSISENLGAFPWTLRFDAIGGAGNFGEFSVAQFRAWNKIKANVSAEMNSAAAVDTAGLLWDYPFASPSDLVDHSAAHAPTWTFPTPNGGGALLAAPTNQMRQTVSGGSSNTLFGGSTMYLAFTGGNGSWLTGDVFATTEKVRAPWSISGTFENFTVTVVQSHPTFTMTLLKNGVATNLSVTLNTAATQVSDLVDQVPIHPGDDVCWQITGVAGSGFLLNWSVEHVANSPGFSSYVCSNLDSFSFLNNDYFMGGLCGNGVASHFNGGPPLNGTLSSSYSISSLGGQFRRLDFTIIKQGSPTTGTFTALIRKNGINQDGTGGTVDTRTTISGTQTTYFNAHWDVTNTFNPGVIFAPGDHLDYAVEWAGSSISGSGLWLGVGCAVLANVDGQFMETGGNGNAPAGTTEFYWTNTAQQQTTENTAQIPVGPTGYLSLGLYVERAAPGSGQSYTDTIRVNGASTTTAVTIANANTAAHVLNTVTIPGNGLVDLMAVPTGGASSSFPHWGLLLQTIENPGPGPTPPAAAGCPACMVNLPLLPAICGQ